MMCKVVILMYSLIRSGGGCEWLHEYKYAYMYVYTVYILPKDRIYLRKRYKLSLIRVKLEFHLFNY